MWLKTEKNLINLALVSGIYILENNVQFATNARTFYEAKNSPEAAQALFEHVAQILDGERMREPEATKIKELESQLEHLRGLLDQRGLEGLGVAELQKENAELKKLVEQMAETLLALRKYPNTYKQTGQGNAVVDNDLMLCDAALDVIKSGKR